MATTIKAQREKIDIAGIEVFGYMLPDDTYRLAGRNVTDIIGEDDKTLPRLMNVKSLKDLPGTTEFHDLRGFDVVLIPLSVAIRYWSHYATKNQRAWNILEGINKNPSKLGLSIDYQIPLPFLRRNIPSQRYEYGVIYVFEDSGNSAYKIGFSTDLEKREKAHKTSNPFLKLVTYYNNQTIIQEKAIHRQLDDYRISGTSEWYHKHQDILVILDRICLHNSTLIATETT